jgi:hypothetical protein
LERRPKGRTPTVVSTGLRGSEGCTERMLRPIFLHKYLRRKALKKKLSELENQLRPYVKFWGAWIKSDECFLNTKEIALINGFTLNKFSLKNTSGVSDETINEIDNLINKLKDGFVKFQLWMAYIFITAILRMAEENADEFFFHTPINKPPVVVKGWKYYPTVYPQSCPQS